MRGAQLLGADEQRTFRAARRAARAVSKSKRPRRFSDEMALRRPAPTRSPLWPGLIDKSLLLRANVGQSASLSNVKPCARTGLSS